jgi:hypothetical protein
MPVSCGASRGPVWFFYEGCIFVSVRPQMSNGTECANDERSQELAAKAAPGA